MLKIKKNKIESFYLDVRGQKIEPTLVSDAAKEKTINVGKKAAGKEELDEKIEFNKPIFSRAGILSSIGSKSWTSIMNIIELIIFKKKEAKEVIKEQYEASIITGYEKNYNSILDDCLKGRVLNFDYDEERKAATSIPLIKNDWNFFVVKDLQFKEKGINDQLKKINNVSNLINCQPLSNISLPMDASSVSKIKEFNTRVIKAYDFYLEKQQSIWTVWKIEAEKKFNVLPSVSFVLVKETNCSKCTNKYSVQCPCKIKECNECLKTSKHVCISTLANTMFKKMLNAYLHEVPSCKIFYILPADLDKVNEKILEMVNDNTIGKFIYDKVDEYKAYLVTKETTLLSWTWRDAFLVENYYLINELLTNL